MSSSPGQPNNVLSSKISFLPILNSDILFHHLQKLVQNCLVFSHYIKKCITSSTLLQRLRPFSLWIFLSQSPLSIFNCFNFARKLFVYIYIPYSIHIQYFKTHSHSNQFTILKRLIKLLWKYFLIDSNTRVYNSWCYVPDQKRTKQGFNEAYNFNIH